MRALLVALAGLGILLLAALVIGPRFVDWSRFKPEIAELAERATGRTLTIDGDIAFSLLPTPTLSAAGVRLGAAASAGEPELVRLKALDARIAFGPLLGGRVVVESIALVEPTVVIDTDNPPSGAWETLDGRLSFDRILVVDGSLEWRVAGTALRVERINAEITAQSVIGPFRISGDVAWRGLPWRFELSSGRLGEASPISATLALRGGGATARLSGTATLNAGETLMTGRLRADGNRVPELLAAFGVARRVPAPLAQALTAEASLQVGRSRVALNDLALTLGDDMRATGAAGLAVEPDGAFDLTLAVNRVDLDKWSSLLAAPTPASARVVPGPAMPRGTVDLTVDAVLWRGGVIRQARLNGALGDGGLTVRQAAAQLPGGSDVAAFGHLALGDAPRFDGQLEGGADNLRSLFAWLQIDAQAIPPDRLRRVSMTTGLSVTGDGVELANLDLQFDASRLTGSLVATLGARPAFGANLRIDRLNLEAYLPRAGRSPPPAAAAPARAPARAAPTAPLEWLTAFDANLQLRVDQLAWNTLPLQGVLVDATLEQSTLSLHELSTESAAGVRVTIGGVVRRARWPAEAELTVTAQGNDPSRLLELIGVDGASPALGPFALSLGATGPLDRVDAVLESEIAGGALRATGALDLATGAPTLSRGTLSVRHPEALRLLRALFPGYRPSADAVGPFELAGALSGAAGKLALADAALKLGPASFEGGAALDLTKLRPELTVKLAGAVLVLDPLLARRPAASSLGAELWAGAMGLPAALVSLPGLDVSAAIELGELDYRDHSATAIALDLTVQDRALRIGRLAGAMWDGRVALSGGFDPARDGTASARLVLADVAAGRAAEALLGVAGLDGRLDAELEVGASGLTERDLRASLAGKGRASARDGSLPGFDLAALTARLRPDAPSGGPSGDLAAQVADDLSHGRTAFTSATATLGVRGPRLMTDDGALSGPAGTVELRGGIDLATRQLDAALVLRVAGDAAAPPARVRLAGTPEQPAADRDAKELIAYLARRTPPAPEPRRATGSGR